MRLVAPSPTGRTPGTLARLARLLIQGKSVKGTLNGIEDH
jgi:hypothetical protein